MNEMWRERVKKEVAAIIAEWNETAQVLHPGHIRDLAAEIAESIPSPDDLGAFERPHE